MEKQRELSSDNVVEIANIAWQENPTILAVNTQSLEDRKCTYCGKMKHTRAECWKLHGTPDWVKQKKGKKKWTHPPKANIAGQSTPFGSDDDSTDNDLDMKQLVKKELQKFLLRKGNLEAGCSAVYAGFAGNVLEIVVTECSVDNWIIDTGATSHMCAKLTNFTQYTAKKLARTVLLPDRTLPQIKHMGTVCFNDKFRLENVLHVHLLLSSTSCQ